MPMVFATMTLSVLVLFVILGSELGQQVRTRPCTTIWAGLFAVLFILAPLLLHLFAGPAVSITGNQITDGNTYAIYALIVSVFVASLWISLIYRHGSRTVGRLNGRIENGSTGIGTGISAERFTHMCSGFIVIGGLMVFVGGTNMSLAELFVASRFSWLADGGSDNRLLNLSYYMMSMVAVFAYFDAKRRVPDKTVSVLVYVAILSMIVLSGERKWILFIGSGWAAGYYDGAGRKLLLRRKFLVAGGLLVLLAFSWQFGRSVDWGSVDGDSLHTVREDFVSTVPILLEEGDATYFYRASLDAIELNTNRDIVYPFAVIRRIIFLPVPDEWTFGLKTEGIPFLFADELQTGNKFRRGNQPPGVVGLFVLSFGWIGAVLVFPLLLVTTLRIADKFVVESNGMVRVGIWATFTVTCILFMRGSTGGLYFMIGNILWMLLIHVAFVVVESIRQALIVRGPGQSASS